MVYALVGSFGTANVGTTSASPTFAQPTSAGNLLVAWLFTNGGIDPITITGGSGWLQAAGLTSSVRIFYKPNCSAAETAPVFTPAGGGSAFAAAVLAEFSGGATSSPVDQVGATSGSPTPVVCANAAADVALGQLFVSCQGDTLSKAGTTTTSATYNNGATASGNANNDATSTASHFLFSYGITTGKTVADQTSGADSSMNLNLIFLCTASFLLAPVTPPAAAQFVRPAFVEIRPNV